MKSNHIVAAAVLLCVAALASVQAAAPLPDRLDRPSPVSSLADRQLLIDIHALGKRLVMVGQGGHILLRAADGTLTQAQVPVDLLLTAVDFVDDQHGWAVGHDGAILHSEDGGQSWHKQLDGNRINQMMLAWAKDNVTQAQQASAAAPQDKALSSALDDANFALDDIKSSAAYGPSRPLMDIWFRNLNDGWVVGAYGIILHTTDGGVHWSYVPALKNPNRLHLYSVLGLADGSVLVAGEQGDIYRSTDGGQTWTTRPDLTPGSLYQLLSLSGGKQLLALGFDGALFSSVDDGQSWQAVAIPSQASLYGGTQLADGSVVLVGQGGTLLYSSDGQHFKLWHVPGKAALMGVAELSSTQLALVGSNGLKIISLATVKGQGNE